MKRQVPPLNGLRAFEAAARHLSFTKAAEELNVTQAAVSHQIKALEERLSYPLFRRLNRALLLSDAGQVLYPAVRDALDGIAAALDRAASAGGAGPLTVSLIPSLAAKWMMARLGHFMDAHEDMDVRLLASEALVDFTREDVDLGIRAGRGSWPGLTEWKITDEMIVPVCSPKLLEGEDGLKTPADLARFTLLHDEMKPVAQETYWGPWLRKAGVDDIVDAGKGPRFSHTYMAVQEATNGRGVAMGQLMIVADDLIAGHLVAPFGPVMTLDFGYYVVAPDYGADREKVCLFRDWVTAQVEDTRAALEKACCLPEGLTP
ncbi:MAG: transcriptional regulator GcvA [Magnetovibrionaceae bacterium]